MNKIFLFAFCLMLLHQNNFSQDLPKGLTPEEIELMKHYQPPIDSRAITTPPSSPVRTMAEWEELQGTVVTWTSYTTIIRQIVDAAQEEGKVFIVCSDSNTVKNSLQSAGVPLYNIEFVIAPFNSVWVRDYGPWTVYTNDVDSLFIVDWIYNRPRPNDDNVPGYIATKINVPIYQTTQSPYNLTHTGGNFMADGMGTGFSSHLITMENSSKTEQQIDAIMNSFMGINRYVKMTVLPYDGIHHIDMHMKLLDEETLLIGQYPSGIADGPQIEANLQYVLSNFNTAFGRPFKIVRIPMPPDQYGRYPNQSGYYRTFTNSVFVNKTVIVPTYELQYDTTALRIYREALPGYNVIGIDCNQIIPASGAIHCITKEVGVFDPILINHKHIRTLIPTESGYKIDAIIKSRHSISSAKIFWTTDTTLAWNEVPMNLVNQNLYESYIPIHPLGTKIYYYISASSNGRTVSKPLPAPQGFYNFVVDFIVPVELVSFYSYAHGNDVQLFWTTGSETNNKGFEIERAAADDEKNFVSVGYINGAGTKATRSDYSFTEQKVLAGKYFYRLKQIDFDGTVSYSNEIFVEVENLNFELSQNYPNPFNPSTTISFSIPKANYVSLIIYNSLGEVVARLIDNEWRSSGKHNSTFSILNSQLVSGVYYYELRSGSFSKRMKLMLMK